MLEQVSGDWRSSAGTQALFPPPASVLASHARIASAVCYAARAAVAIERLKGQHRAPLHGLLRPRLRCTNTVIGYRLRVRPQADFVSRRGGRRRAFRVGPYVVVDVGEVGPRRMTSATLRHAHPYSDRAIVLSQCHDGASGGSSGRFGRPWLVEAGPASRLAVSGAARSGRLLPLPPPGPRGRHRGG